MVKPKIDEEEFDAGIEDLKNLMISISCLNYEGDEYRCSECIDTVHKLLDILALLTGKEDKEFRQKIYDIIGE